MVRSVSARMANNLIFPATDIRASRLTHNTLNFQAKRREIGAFTKFLDRPMTPSDELLASLL